MPAGSVRTPGHASPIAHQQERPAKFHMEKEQKVVETFCDSDKIEAALYAVDAYAVTIATCIAVEMKPNGGARKTSTR